MDLVNVYQTVIGGYRIPEVLGCAEGSSAKRLQTEQAQHVDHGW